MTGDIRARADEIFERFSPYEGLGLRHHCLRLDRFTSMLLEQAGLRLDRDLLYLAAMLHDLGLVVDDVEGDSYLARSQALFRRETADLGLDPGQSAAIDECLLYNHRVRPVPGTGPEAERFRQAVWIEHSRGLLRFGLDRGAIRQVFAELPRDNLDRVLLDFTRRVLVTEPRTLVDGIFF